MACFRKNILALSLSAFAVSCLSVLPASAQEADEEALIRLRPIEILGDRLDHEPGSQALIGADAIIATNADHPAEILNRLPGVNIHTNSGQEHLLAIRSPVLTGGAGQGSFLVLQNGVPTRAAAFGNVNALLELHHEMATGIEVVRGPGSAKYGSNAVHGLLNVIFPAPGEFNGTEVNISGSTLSRYKTDIELSNGDWGWAALSLQHDQGWRDLTGLGQQKASASASFEIGAWDATATASLSNLNQETAGFILGSKTYRDSEIARSNANPEAYRDASTTRASVRLTRDYDGFALTLTSYALTQDMEFRQHFLPYKGIEENGHDTIGLMTRMDFDARGDIDFRIGADLSAASGYLIETQPAPFGFFPGDGRFPVGKHYDFDVETRTAAVWGEAEWEFAPDVTLLAGLRAEAHDYDYITNIPAGTFGRFQVAPDRMNSFNLLTPKLGLIWQGVSGSDIALYANYARGQRAPQASDLYRLQSLQTPGEIKTESLDSFEIGARGALLDGVLNFDLAAYSMDKRNFFFRDADGLNVPGGKTRHAGVELAFDWTAIDDALTVKGAVSWSDHTYAFNRPVGRAGESITAGNQIDTAPEWLSDVQLVWTPTTLLTLTLGAEHISEYFTDAESTRTYPGHTVFHLRGNWRLDESLALYISVRNLFDLNYADRADFAFGNDRYFPGEPMNATFGLRKRFGS